MMGTRLSLSPLPSGYLFLIGTAPRVSITVKYITSVQKDRQREQSE